MVSYANIKKTSYHNKESLLYRICNSMVATSAIILFFLMMFSPRTNLLAKVPFLLFILISRSLIIIQTGRIKINTKVFLWALIYVSFGALWGAYGLVNSKEYAIDFLRLNIIWVIFYMFFVLIISKPEHIKMAQKVMIWASLAIALYNINYVLYGMGYLHIPQLIDLDMGQAVGLHAGYVQLTAHNIGSLMFLFPFLFSGMAITRGGYFAGVPKWFLTLVLIMCLITVFLSGRRMLWLITIIAPLLYFGIIEFGTKSIAKFKFKQVLPLFIVGIIIVLGQYLFFETGGWDLDNFIERLTFSGEQAQGYDYRINSIDSLMNDMRDCLFFGTGGGSPAFEVTFMQVFHETGIIGLPIFIGLFLWVYFQIFRLIKQKKGNIEQGIPLLIGGICFFLGMFSNPYYSSFDFMWSLFLPLAYVNVYLRG
ncbi:MAG: hypothetical protein ABFC84_18640 [Veillonellales bacterium]